MKKITLITTLLLCLMMTLNACSSYRDDVDVNDLTSEILNSVSTQGGYTAMDELFLSLEFANPSLIESDVSEWMICASNSQSTVDEFGIFHVKDGEAETMKAICEAYIAKSKDRWVAQANYIASEHPKMEGAEIRIFGNYVVYTMLTEADKAIAFDAVESALK